ncbi:arylsulfatase, partial [bacterium]|nr:arylsulfatase [bacterium]
MVMGSSALLLMYPQAIKAMDTDTKPNIILILVDDMGYGDLSCYGGTGYQTPNLDRLANMGIMFTSFYSGSSVSTPSRAALLTGCYPPRIGLTDVLLPGARVGLNQVETTIPEMLKEVGYVSGIIGKWHLGDHKNMMPLDHGFDEYYGLPYSNDLWPVHYNGKPVTRNNYLKEWKLHCPPLFLFDGREAVKEIKTLEDQAQLTTLYTNRALDFIERNMERPFFLYFAHNMPHVPLG